MVSPLKNNFAGRDAAGKHSARIQAGTRHASDERHGLFLKSLVDRALTNDTSLAHVSLSNAVAAQRRETLCRFNLLKKNRGGVKAARIVGVSIPTLWRWQNKFAAHGLPGLRPANFKSGRRSPFKEIRLSAQAARALELLIAESSSRRAAWQKFAASSLCPPSVARHVQRKGNAPAPLARLGHIKPVQARVFISADGHRVFVKLPARAALTAKLSWPVRLALHGGGR